MITVATPAFLVAGGILALMPVVLHLLSRRPPDRAALPTARFLAEDPRTLLRLRRVPSDVPLLALRVLFALVLGAAFADVRWMPEREGTRRVVLVDAGADPVVEWGAVVNAVAQVSGPDAVGSQVSGSGSENPPLVLAYGLDDGPAVVTAAAVGGLTRGSTPATLEDGLRALRGQVAMSRFAEAEVTWVGRPSWRIWSPGLGLLRSALWPGRLRLRAIGAAEGEGAGESTPTPAAPTAQGGASRGLGPLARIAVTGSDGALERAVAALGGRLADSTSAGMEDAPDWIIAELTGDGEPWVTRARAGATLLAFGDPPSGPTDLPWALPPAQASPLEPALLLLSGDRAVGGAVPRTGGHPGRGARTLALFDDAVPAAAARMVGEGCVVFVAARLTHPALTASPAYPELLRTLLLGCHEPGYGDGPLDRGAMQALERPDLPPAVEAATVVSHVGRPWTRWLVLVALGLLALEILLTRAERTPSAAAVARRTGGP